MQTSAASHIHQCQRSAGSARRIATTTDANAGVV
jgi:hypothetical protein